MYLYLSPAAVNRSSWFFSVASDDASAASARVTSFLAFCLDTSSLATPFRSDSNAARPPASTSTEGCFYDCLGRSAAAPALIALRSCSSSHAVSSPASMSTSTSAPGTGM